MRPLYLILVILTSLMVNSCLKTSPLVHEPSEDTFVSVARRYFTDSVLLTGGDPVDYQSRIKRTVLWDRAKHVQTPTAEGVLVPVQYNDPLFIKATSCGDRLFHLNDLTHLLVYRQAGGAFHAEVLMSVPDTAYLLNPTASFTGQLFVTDWLGNPLDKYLYTGSEVRKYRPPSVQVTSISGYCSTIYGYNYSPGDPGRGYAWSQPGPCYFFYFPDQGGEIYEPLRSGLGYGDNEGSDGSGSGLNGNIHIVIPPPDNPIANVADYFKCFTNVGGSDHKYTVTICVDQPVPNTRTPWTPIPGGPIGSSNGGNVVDVGHTFLIFTESYGGTNITRNVGFYPTAMVNPASKSSQGRLNNDEGHEYNISATFTVPNATFFTMLNFAARGNTSGFMYNLNTENCTSYALQTLVQGGINLPSTMGTWIGGVGNNPGDLGEDIRQMTPLANMTKSTVENFHPNIGNCN